MIGGLRAPGAPQQAAFASRGSLPLAPTSVPPLAELELRRSKCRQPSLRLAAEQWWATSKKSSRKAADEEHTLARDEYVRLNCALYRALVPITWDEERAVECAMQDWCNDAGSEAAPAIAKHIFFASLFELADAWAPRQPTGAPPLDVATAAARDATWLDQVFETIARPILSADGQPQGFVWKELADIPCIVQPYTPALVNVSTMPEMREVSGSMTPFWK